jgi:hypothetical protein
VFARVIENVPSTTTTAAELGLDHSMIALARIDIPASTGTITQSMIHDLRFMSHQRSARRFGVFNCSANQTYVASSTWSKFPTEVTFNVDVPTWATHVRGTFQIALLAVLNGGATSNAVSGFMAMQLDTAGQAALRTGNTLFMVDAAWFQPVNIFGGGEALALPVGYRGKTAQVSIAVESFNTPEMTDHLVWGTNSGVASIDVEFYQAPIAAA